MVALILAIFGFSENFIVHPARPSYSESSYCCGKAPPEAFSPEQSAAKEVELQRAAEKENTNVKINFLNILISPI